jgi:hypothetical protein
VTIDTGPLDGSSRGIPYSGSLTVTPSYGTSQTIDVDIIVQKTKTKNFQFFLPLNLFNRYQFLLELLKNRGT